MRHFPNDPRSLSEVQSHPEENPMLKTFKALPTWAKVLICLLVVGTLYRMTHIYHGPTNHYQQADYRQTGSDSSADFDTNDNNNIGRDTGRGSPAYRGESQAPQQLAQFKAQQQQIQAQVQQCEQQMTQATNQMAAAAMQGGMYNSRPQCESMMPQWVSQEAYVETEIYRLQTGDRTSSLRQVTGIAPPDYSTGDANTGGRVNSDRAAGIVDRWDRGAIRGTSMYTDESGEQHELPTRNYYFRDKATGQMVGSDSPNRPNNQQDFEQFNGPQ
jgi:hypothetical protein